MKSNPYADSRAYERYLLQELNSYAEQSCILQIWKPEAYLDSGTFSRIFRARHWQTGAVAALKFIPNPLEISQCGEEGSSENLYNRTRYAASKREAEIMNRFRGVKHVVQYLEEPEYLQRVFPNPDGKMVIQYAVLICMPLYQNDKEWMPRIIHDRERRLQLGVEMAYALMQFEKKGVYHRDIKPGNILMDQAGNFYLGDVGEAKLESDFTTTGFHGTRPYMAPEVYNQENERSKMRSDHRSDLYSLGIILYRLFNGQQFPFLTESGTLTEEAAQSFRQYEKKYQIGERQRYLTDSERARLLRYDDAKLPAPKDADKRLAQVILKACAYKLKDRYQTAQELYQALAGCLKGKALLPERTKMRRPQRTRREGANKRIVIAWGAVAMIAAFAGAGFMYVKSRRDDHDPGMINTVTFAATVAPTAAPVVMPIAEPTATVEPTATPTAAPTVTPMAELTATPTAAPTVTPTAEPTATPTAMRTATPTAAPTVTPTAEPAVAPTATSVVTPHMMPIAAQTLRPTMTPVTEPAVESVSKPVSEQLNDHINSSESKTQYETKEHEERRVDEAKGHATGMGGNTIEAVVTLDQGTITACIIHDEWETELMRSGYDLAAQALIGKTGQYVREHSAKALLKEIQRFAQSQGKRLTPGDADRFAANDAITAVKDALNSLNAE